MIAKLAVVPLAIVALIFGFPLAELMVHGLNTSLWPTGVARPSAWFESWIDSYTLKPLWTYVEVFIGRTNSLGPYGRLTLGFIFSAPALAIIFAFSPALRHRRDPYARYGDARWMTRRELAKMQVGLEFGLNSHTRRPSRMMIESHVVSIAAPRTGKTSGLLIPNLVAPDPQSWFGPAFVFDPKAESFKATAERRRDLGRTVRCFDPVGIADGADTWNPARQLDPRDILYLQRVARALLSQNVTGDSAYFINGAVSVIVGGFLAAGVVGVVTPAAVYQLISDVDAFAKALEPVDGLAAGNAKAILRMESKGRDSILSTARQAFDWVCDPRLEHATTENTFDLVELCRGDTDIFVPLPAEDLETLAPLLRWMLTELFATVRRQRPRERIVCFVDEAATMFGGHFNEFLRALGELPGHNLSLWTFWQSHSQIVETFGKEGAQTLLNTSEVATVSDLPLIDPDGREFLSRAIGDYTILEEVTTFEQNKKKSSVSQRPTPVRLMTADALAEMPTTKLIVLPNSKRYAKRPTMLNKTTHDDPRLTRLIQRPQGRAVV